ncbi:DNA (cytosine-5-)-methyltransferase [Mycoplasma sp. AC157]
MKFLDLCSGIGGGRLGLELNGLQCIGHSEIEENTAETYKLLFNDDKNFGDLTKIKARDLPDFDFVIAGFPCQTFSIVGKREGLEDERGQIIYHIIRILKEKQTKYFILENVKGLINHDKGKTFEIIKNELQNAGYNIFYKVLNTKDFGIPHSRERIYIVGFKNNLNILNFEFPQEKEKIYNFNNFIDKNNTNILETNNKTFLKYLGHPYNQNLYSINDILKWENTVIDTRQSDLRKYNEIFPTLRKGRHGLLYIQNKQIKKLNGYEALLLQVFPKEIVEKAKKMNLNNNKLLSQAGNAMTVTVIQKIASKMLTIIREREKDGK